MVEELATKQYYRGRRLTATNVVQEASEALAESRAANIYYTMPGVTKVTIVVREQPQESSYFEALLEPRGVRGLYLIKTLYQDYTIFNIQYLSISF